MPYDKKDLALIWRHTHADYKGKRDDGTKCVLYFQPGSGTTSCPIEALPQAVFDEKLADAKRCEERRLARA